MRSSIKVSVAAVLALAMASCGSGGGGGGGDTPAFQFRTSEDVSLGIAVMKAGVPVPGATISLAPPLTAAAASNGATASQPYFVGGSGDDGRCDTTISLPADVSTVDVIVRHDGSTGSYSDEALRALWGPFAPAARITVSVGSLSNLTIVLEDS